MYTRHLTLFESSQKKQFQAKTEIELACLYVISGPSGVGKTTIINRLINEIPKLEKIVAYTTRKIRPGEIEEKTYHYITPNLFQSKMQQGDFIEYLNFCGNYYGFGFTKTEILNKLTSGIDLIVDMDYSQITDLKTKVPNCYSIFIMPPCVEDLKTRLIIRGDTAESIEKRMHCAQKMIANANVCDQIIINENDKLDDTVQAIESIILNNRINFSENTLKSIIKH